MRVYWSLVFLLGFLAALWMAARAWLWPRLRSRWRAFQAGRQRPLSRMAPHELAYAFEHRPEAFEPYRRRGTISEDELIEEMAAAMFNVRTR